MAGYTPNQWRNYEAGGTAISADRLNHIEDGISGSAVVADMADPSTPTGHAVAQAIASTAGQIASPGGPARLWAPQAALPTAGIQNGDLVPLFDGYLYARINGTWKKLDGTAYTPPAQPATTTLALSASTPTYTAGTTPFASVQVNWATTAGTDNLNPAKVRIKRDGTNIYGAAPQNHDQTALTGAYTFTNLTPGATYHISAQFLDSFGGLLGDPVSVTVAMPSAPPATTPTTLKLTATPADGAVTVVNKVTAGSDGYSPDAIILSRNGTDANGTGPWSTTVPPNSSFVFASLVNGTEYTFTGDMSKGGTAQGNPVSVKATPLAAGGGGTTPTPGSAADTAFTYAGTWIVDTATGGVSEHYSNTTGATATITFTVGTGGGTVSFLTVKSPVAGQVGLKIDSGSETVVDCYNATEQVNANVWTSGSLAAGDHTLTVRVTGTKNASSGGTYISVLGASLSNGTFPTSGGGTGGGGTGGGSTGGGGVPASQKLARLTMPARGWFSGGSGSGIYSYDSPGQFGTWRGDPIDAIATWQDQPDGSVWNYVADEPGANFTGWADYAIGGPSNMASAAAGSLDSALADYLTRLRAYRTINGVVQPTSVRPCHEMNGNWYAWSVYPGGETTFKQAMRRWRGILDQNFPEAFFCLSFNRNTVSGIQAADLYEDGVWDIIGTDWYNMNDDFSSNWSSAITMGSSSDPYGIEQWRQFAQVRGLPLYLPEWGQNAPSCSNTGYYVQNLVPYIKAHRGNGAGQIVAEMVFNIGSDFELWPSAAQPAFASAYAAAYPA